MLFVFFAPLRSMREISKRVKNSYKLVKNADSMSEFSVFLLPLYFSFSMRGKKIDSILKINKLNNYNTDIQQ